MSEMRIVEGSQSKSPILVLSRGYAYLSSRYQYGTVGKFVIHDNAFTANPPYTKPLTDEEEALAMKLILLHG